MLHESAATPRAGANDVTYTLIFSDAGEERRHTLAGGATVIGRAPTCDVVLTDSSVSRWHVQFSVDGGQCVVKDIGSRNGTYLNGDQIEQAALRDGDRLVLGDRKSVV